MTKKQSLGLATLTIVTVLAGAFCWAYVVREKRNRAACLINQSAITTSIASWHSMNGIDDNRPLNWAEIVGPNKPFRNKVYCPSKHEYIFAPTYAKGHENGYVKCPHQDHHEH